MRRIIIEREKVKFVGRLINYDCFLNVNKEVFEENLKRAWENSRDGEHDEDEEVISFFDNLQSIPVSNGKSISIEIDEQQNELFVAAGHSVSNLQTIEVGNSDVSFFIKTNYSWTKGMVIILHKNRY